MMIQNEIVAEVSDDHAWYAIRVDQKGLTLRDLSGSKVKPAAATAGTHLPRPQGFAVEEILRRRGYNPFIPVESIFIRRNRYRPTEKRRVKRVILPGMVFLSLPVRGMNWLSLLTAPMVHGVFGLQGVPYRFSQAGIERLIAISDSLKQPDFYRPMPTRRGYEVGDAVVDISGLFEGALKVVEIKGNTAKVLAPFFGEMREIAMQAAQLAKAVD